MKLYIVCSCGYVNGPFDSLEELELMVKIHELAALKSFPGEIETPHNIVVNYERDDEDEHRI